MFKVKDNTSISSLCLTALLCVCSFKLRLSLDARYVVAALLYPQFKDARYQHCHFLQIATLASVYHKPAETFVSRQRIAVQKAEELQVSCTSHVSTSSHLFAPHAPLVLQAWKVLPLKLVAPVSLQAHNRVFGAIYLGGAELHLILGA